MELNDYVFFGKGAEVFFSDKEVEKYLVPVLDCS